MTKKLLLFARRFSP